MQPANDAIEKHVQAENKLWDDLVILRELSDLCSKSYAEWKNTNPMDLEKVYEAEGDWGYCSVEFRDQYQVMRQRINELRKDPDLNIGQFLCMMRRAIDELWANTPIDPCVV